MSSGLPITEFDYQNFLGVALVNLRDAPEKQKVFLIPNSVCQKATPGGQHYEQHFQGIFMHKIFLSYSHKDEAWKDRLVTQHGVLQMQDLLEIWEDRQIATGDDWLPAIEIALSTCNIAILLISANFLTSQFILGKEVPRLLELRQSEGVRVIPLIIKPCAWQKVAWLKPIQARPKDGRALSGGNDHQIDIDLAALANELAELLQPMPHAPSPTRFIPLPPEKIFTAKLPTTTDTLFGREDDLKRLDAAWADPNTHVLTLVAWGGVGKTALVNEWLTRIAKENYRGAERVYAWSFYSQGTREDRQVSGDEFIAHALKWFGDPDPNAGAPWDKGARLAALIRQQKNLLVLDGLEPLQYPPGPLHGQFKDQGVQALLKQLAGDSNGLCIVTTRLHVTDVAHKTKSSVQAVDLENLSAEAGAQLLKSLGVIGREPELRAASKEYEGHALALNLLGSYLATVHEGEVRKRDLIPHLIEREAQPGYHAYRVMASYELWLAATPELEILFLMGLFDRPAAKGAIDALLAPPAIVGLTSNVQNLSFDKWQFTLKRLRELRLLAEKDASRPDTLDCHPLVREHFSEKLRSQNPDAWKEAHSRLYEYHKKLPAKELPDTLEEMEPLFAAVVHGCQAGRHQEVNDEIFFKRIKRESEYYVIHKHGAFGSFLAVVSNFFENPWHEPSAKLNEETRAGVLSQAGFGLQALGRLREAAQPMQACLEMYKKNGNPKNVAIATGNLSELYLTLGEVKHAMHHALQGVEYADKSKDVEEREENRATLAHALHQAGKLPEANTVFLEAEAIQKEYQASYPLLYSVRGFKFCDLLLSQGQYQDVQKRASQTIEIAEQNHWLLDIALDKVSIGRAFLLLALSNAEGQASRQYFDEARDYLQLAVTGLRKAGTQDHLPRGLFARAACYRAQNEFALAAADLEEAREIAERGEMKLFLADYHLEAGRLALAEGKREKANEHLEAAAKMIEQMGYGRRKPEVEELERQIKSI